MLIGFAVIVLGFILMSGGGSDDPNVFNEDMFSFRRITLAPLLVLGGFAFEIYAIMKKPKKGGVTDGGGKRSSWGWYRDLRSFCPVSSSGHFTDFQYVVRSSGAKRT